MYDCIIIGSGVSGSAVARELSRYDLKVAVLEKEEDVCCGTSKANSAIVHAGFDAKEGTLMAKLNVEGNQMIRDMVQDLEIPFNQNGSLVVCVNEDERDGLETLLQRGIKNGVEGLRIIERDELLEMEPNISDQAVAALYAPTGGIICPFELNLAMAENSKNNGVDFFFDTRVEEIESHDNMYIITTNNGTYESKSVVNAAGVYADTIHNLVSEEKMEIIPRKGEYFILDKAAGTHVSHTIFALPSIMGKGILVSPTVHGNLMVGPTAMDIEDKDGINTTKMGLDDIRSKVSLTVKDVPLYQSITNFAGLRAHEAHHEFIIKEVKDGFFDCAAIESPGLTSSPAIGKMVADMIVEKYGYEKKDQFISKRKGPIYPNEMRFEERKALIEKNPLYGSMVCRCEMVSEGEIVDSIHRTIGAKSLDGVKRRTRAGMGRCQAGFCSVKTMEILAREIEGLNYDDVTKSGKDSEIIVGINKDRL